MCGILFILKEVLAMPKAKYQFEDFLVTVPPDLRSFIAETHEMLLSEGYKPKITVTKTTGFQLAYHQPKIKSVKGIILIFFLQNGKLVARIYADNCAKYPDVLNGLPKGIINQINSAPDCMKFANPQKCWTGCLGYDFIIAGKRYQKCYVACFQLRVDFESVPYIIEIIKNESRERCD